MKNINNLLKGSRKLVKFAKLTKDDTLLNEAQKTLRAVQKASKYAYKVKNYKKLRLKNLEQETISQYTRILRELGVNNSKIKVRTKDNKLKVPNLKQLDLKEVRKSTKNIRGKYLKKNLKNFDVPFSSIKNDNNLQNILKDLDISVLNNIWKYKDALEKYFKKFFNESKNEILNETIRSLFGREEISDFMFGLKKMSDTSPSLLKKVLKDNNTIKGAINLVKALLK